MNKGNITINSTITLLNFTFYLKTIIINYMEIIYYLIIRRITKLFQYLKNLPQRLELLGFELD